MTSYRQKTWFYLPTLVRSKFDKVMPFEFSDHKIPNPSKGSITILIREISFRSLNICDQNPSTLQTDTETDRQTDGQTTFS